MIEEEIEKEYCKLTKEIESMRIYDSRNTVDRYVCEKCGALLHTTYKDKGVTPFVITCPKCGGMMSHTQTFRKNGTRSTNTKTKNYDTRKRESAHKETERRRI